MQERDRNIEKKKEKTQEENVKNERTVSISKKNRLLYQFWSTNKREVESFYSTEVNLVLNTHALQIILFGPFYVQAQYHFGSLQIESLQTYTQEKYLIFL